MTIERKAQQDTPLHFQEPSRVYMHAYIYAKWNDRGIHSRINKLPGLST